MTVSLDFLDPDRKYTAKIYADAPDADGAGNTYETGSESCSKYVITERQVTSKTKLKLRMAPSGGFAISIR